MGDIQNHIPPRPSEDFIGALLGDRVKPMEVLVSVSVAASFVILVSGTFCPYIKVIGWFVFVPTVGIAMGMIVSMFGAVMHYLTPFATFAVFLCNFLSHGKRLTLCSDGRLRCHGRACADGVS